MGKRAQGSVATETATCTRETFAAWHGRNDFPILAENERPVSGETIAARVRTLAGICGTQRLPGSEIPRLYCRAGEGSPDFAGSLEAAEAAGRIEIIRTDGAPTGARFADVEMTFDDERGFRHIGMVAWLGAVEGRGAVRVSVGNEWRDDEVPGLVEIVGGDAGLEEMTSLIEAIGDIPDAGIDAAYGVTVRCGLTSGGRHSVRSATSYDPDGNVWQDEHREEHLANAVTDHVLAVYAPRPSPPCQVAGRFFRFRETSATMRAVRRTGRQGRSGELATFLRATGNPKLADDVEGRSRTKPR